jgi:uncharacterized membrane protein YccC
MSLFRRYYAQFRLAVRITVAGLLAYVLCQLFGLAQSYQAVLTSVIVMQGSVGASLKAVLDRLLGSLGGALWAVAVIVGLQNVHQFHSVVVILIVLVPMAILAAFNPAYRAAPATAIILLLAPASINGPLAPAIQRMSGIGLGGFAAFFVALLVLPVRIQGTFAEAAGRVSARMAELAAILINGVNAPGEPGTTQRLHDEVRKSINQAELVAEEVLRERATHLSEGPDPLPMCRALRRIRNDLAMIGRVTSEVFPELVRERLTAPSQTAAAAVAGFLADCGNAISGRVSAPSLETVERELAQFASTLTGLRWIGPMRDLPDDVVGRIYGLAFSLEQLQRNLKEFVDRIDELAADGK